MKSAGSLVFEITQTNGSFNSDFFKELEPMFCNSEIPLNNWN
jgi:hypothetical protein